MIAIVTDSTSYIPRSVARSLNVVLVPTHYVVGSKQYNEGYGDENENFAAIAAKGEAPRKTSQASVADFSDVFEKLIKKDYNVLCVVMSSRLSGTCSSAAIAAKQIDPERIMVVDSLTTAGGLFLLVKKAAELIKEKMPLHAIAEELDHLKKQIGIVFSVDSMEPLRMSGRLGIVPQSVGTVLNNRPILLCQDGTIVSRGLVRGRQEQIRKMVEYVPMDAKEVIIHYLDDNRYVESIISEIQKRFPQVVFSVARLGPVLGVHLGIGVMGIAWSTI